MPMMSLMARRPKLQAPDFQAYSAWRQLVRKYPGGLMHKAEVARLFGCANSNLVHYVRRGQLTEVHVPGNPRSKGWVPVDQVLDLVEKSGAFAHLPTKGK